MITELEEKQLKLEIAHIFESGANEIRVFNMIKDFLGKRDFELNTLPITVVGCTLKEKEETAFSLWLKDWKYVPSIDAFWIGGNTWLCREEMKLKYNKEN